jgi:hypothetical protein
MRRRRELMSKGELIGELKGAPLRCTLAGAGGRGPACWSPARRRAAPIPSPAKALARRWKPACWPPMPCCSTARRGSDAQVRAAYEVSLQALKPKFELYERANRVNAFPWLADLLIWRARRSPRLLRA